MKGSKALLLTLAITAGLLVLMVAARAQYPRLAAEHWRRQLGTVPDDQAGILLRQVAELGEPGISVMVEALGSRRESVARAGKRTLLEQLDGWQILRAGSSSPKLATLADALAERVERFGPTARNDAADLAARILHWPLDSQAVDRRRVIAACERVFRAAAVPGGVVPRTDLSVGHLPPIGRPDTLRPGLPWAHRPPSAQKPADFGTSLVDLSRLPGGGLPIESFPQPAAPQRAGTTLPGDTPAQRPRRLPVPRFARRIDAWGQPDRSAVAPGQSSGTPDPESPSDRPPVPNTGRAMSLSEPADAHPGSRWGSFTETETIRLMQWLEGRDQPTAAAARAELIRRGFREVHLELARRLFDPDPDVRKELARLLPGVQSVDAVPWLWWLSRDPDPEVRLVAIGLIATTGDATLLEQIERAAREDPDPRIRQLARRIAGQRNVQRRR